MSLLPKQLEAIEKLKKYKVGALFMEAGSGKTRAAYELLKNTDADYVLYLAPYQTLNNENIEARIQTEIAKCGGFDVRYDFVGIESLSSSDRIYLECYSKLGKANKAMVICDESLKIKNRDAKRTQRIIELGKLAEYRLILNGTPLSRDLLDVWSQFEFLSPKILNMNYNQFKDTFCEYTVMRKRIGNRSITREWINAYHNVEYLYSLIQPYVFECELDIDVNKQYIDTSYIVDDELRQEYKEIKDYFLSNDRLEYFNNKIFLMMTQKMQHSYCLSSEKFDYVRRFLRDNDPAKVAIATKFVSSRLAVEDAFPKVKVLSYGKHSFGLNLQQYDTTIFWDKTFDYGKQEQIEHRTYRTGQESKIVRYISLTGDVGLEKLMDNNIQKKIKLLDYFKKYGIEKVKEEL